MGGIFRFLGDFILGLAMATGAVLGVQFPAFIQQYLQNLSGRIDELTKILEAAELKALDAGKNLNSYAQYLAQHDDPIVRPEGAQLLESITRLEQLNAAFDRLSQADALQLILAFAQSFDSATFDNTLLRYQPSIVLDQTAAIYGLVGAILVFVGLRILAGLVPSRREKEIRFGKTIG